MKGISLLIVFFTIFLIASLLIPSPMFPGNMFCTLIGGAISEHFDYLSAVFNGLFYGALLWLIFTLISRKLGEEK